MTNGVAGPSTVIPAVAGRGRGSRMIARAHLSTEIRTTSSGRARNCISTLHSEAPLVLRIARAKAPEPWAADAEDVLRVALTAGSGGPVGGDQLDLMVDVGARSSVVLTEISPTLLLPGPYRECSRTGVHIRVATGGTLIWLPEPMIAAHRCDHLNEVEVNLEEGARFFMREEILLGRHGEPSGQVRQRVSVRLAGRPLYRHDLQVGTADSSTPTVLGDHRAVGSTLIVDPSWVEQPPQGHWIGPDAAVMKLAGPAALITALGRDNLAVRRDLQAGLAAIGAPWNPKRHNR